MEIDVIRQNFEQVRARVEAAAHGRAVTLICVTKTVDVHAINAAIACGATDIGENKVQELLGKCDALQPVRRHLIGQLQSNKVKQIIGKVDLIHSVDKLSLAAQIDRCADKANIVMPILVQVNIANEPTKGGVQTQELFPLLEQLGSFAHIRVRGLMCIPPPDVALASGYFQALRELLEGAKQRFYGDCFDLEELSMGMSGDYESAIEQGATMVRVGSAIFGYRDYTNRTDAFGDS